MSNFKDYAENRNKNNETSKKFKNGNQNSPSKNAFEMLKNIAQKYEGASQTDLINAIIAEAAKSKANGTLTNADIENFVNTVSPMLNASQKSLLDEVVNKIKK